MGAIPEDRWNDCATRRLSQLAGTEPGDGGRFAAAGFRRSRAGGFPDLGCQKIGGPVLGCGTANSYRCSEERFRSASAGDCATLDRFDASNGGLETDLRGAGCE